MTRSARSARSCPADPPDAIACSRIEAARAMPLERAPDDVPRQHFVSILKDLRESLRFVLDANAVAHNAPVNLAELLAPLRHRMARLFDAQGLGWHWQQDDAAVLPHANRVEVGIQRDGQGLRLRVCDNGVGIPAHADLAHLGTGARRRRREKRKESALDDA